MALILQPGPNMDRTAHPARTGLVLLALLALSGALSGLTGCGAEGPPRLSDAGPPVAAPPSRWKWEPGTNGATLVATGRQSFEGRSAFRCVLHEKDGLQINLRTGDPDLPAVAVRIEELRGSGSYRARLFVTGRNRTGALAGSLGEVSLDLRQRESPAQAGGGDQGSPVFLSGWFEGTYDGEAGRGSVQGRFAGCSYVTDREETGQPASVSGRVAQAGP